MSSAALGANVLEVAHERISVDLHVDEVAVRLQLETRGLSHAEDVVTRLRECGYPSSTDARRHLWLLPGRRDVTVRRLGALSDQTDLSRRRQAV